MTHFEDLRALETVDNLLEKSSLGTPGARRLRQRTELAHAEALVAKADQPEDAAESAGSPLLDLDDVFESSSERDVERSHELLNHLVAPMTRYCRAGLGSTSRADDIAQQVLTDVLEYLPNHPGDGRALLRWTWNHASAAVGRLSTSDPDLAPPDRFAALAWTLPERDRAVLLFRVALGLTCTDAGNILGIEPQEVLAAQSQIFDRLRSRTEQEKIIVSPSSRLAEMVGSRTVVRIDLVGAAAHRASPVSHRDILLEMLERVGSRTQVPQEAIERTFDGDGVLLVCRYPELAVMSLVEQLLIALVERNRRTADPNARLRAQAALGTGYMSRDEAGAPWVGRTVSDVRELAAGSRTMLFESPWSDAVLAVRSPIPPVLSSPPDKTTPFRRMRIATPDGEVEAYVQQFGVTPADTEASGWFEVAFDSVTVAGGRGSGKSTFASAVSDPGTRTEVSFPGGLASKVGRVEMHHGLTLAVLESPTPAISHLPGTLGTVLVVDTRALADCFPLIDRLEEREVPYVVAVHDVDGTTPHSVEEIRTALEVSAPILRCDVRDRASALGALKELVDHALPTTPHPRQPGFPPSPPLVKSWSPAPWRTDDGRTDQIPALAGSVFDHHDESSQVATSVLPAVATGTLASDNSAAEYGRHAATPDAHVRTGRHRPPR
ncbi:hypothetical protein [Amycolatopsis sp. MtRt-6]|uniref:hypothetical protein n=1 Tax=Amycolatopsis sp. MtRt-6 TaxID=2792782 RepID=UPI001A8C613D|nr:hypothetical protein [Amycolatopsis sp. MtRt-6]